MVVGFNSVADMQSFLDASKARPGTLQEPTLGLVRFMACKSKLNNDVIHSTHSTTTMDATEGWTRT